MFVVGDRVVCGATDLELGGRCEFALLRAFDAELGTLAAAGTATTALGDCVPPAETAPGYADFARLLASVRERHGADVVAVPRVDGTPATTLTRAHTASVTALRDGAPAVHGVLLYDDDLFAHADLAVGTPQGVRLHGAASGPEQAAATALRLSACADLLATAAIPVAAQLALHIGTESRALGLADALPVYRARRQRTEQILDEHASELLPVQWGDPRFRACGHCVVCVAACAAARDLLLVAGMDRGSRAGLRAAGVTSIDRLATRTTAPAGVPAAVLTRLRAQALVQLRRESTGRGERAPADAAALDMLPPATPGDLALYTHRPAPDRVRVEVVSRDGVTLTRELPIEPPAGTLPVARRTALRDTARRAFTDLLATLTEPLLAAPELHIFHYTTAARTLLLHTGARLGVGEETVDALLRTGALVDLYPIVRGAFVLGTSSYTLAEVAMSLGEPPTASTGHTVRWLADRLREEARAPAPGPGDDSLDGLLRETPPVWSSSTEAALAEYAAGRPDAPAAAARGPQPSGTEPARAADPHRTAAVTAALLGYHRREQQRQWWAHIDRLTHPLPEWDRAPGVMVADTCVLDTNWHIGPDDTARRFLRLAGRLTGGGPAPGARVHIVYEPRRRTHRAIRTVGTATVLGCSVAADLTDTVRLEESLAPGAEAHDELPVALAPVLEPAPDTGVDALEDIGGQLLVTLPAVPDTAVFDLLTGRAPRFHDTPPGPPFDTGDDPAATITAALLGLDRSCLAVQAPTGTGRTAILAEVLAGLVTRDHWRIGIVGPCPAPVENLLEAVVRAGVLPELVAKSEAATAAPEWLVLDTARYPRFLANAIRGCVLGGTPDDFTDPGRVPRDALDLLVVTDANAFPLAAAAAAAPSAGNLLLLGDPTVRRSPVHPGPHPEPVDTPALTWFTSGRRTLPAELGFFLGRTRRMAAQVSDPLSRLYFDDRLRADSLPAPAGVTLEAGIGTVLVAHHGNTTSSAAEAREVLQQIRDLLGRQWYDGTEVRRLEPHDVVVVSPHRAQVSLLRTWLSRARMEEVLVGTPELLRGREAAVVLLSPATSSPEDAPGPIGELLSPALVHDTLCRARRRAIIVRSPLLTEYLPETLTDWVELSRFIRLG